MRPFGIIILIMVFYILFKNRKFSDIYIKILALTMCVEVFINLGYFIIISNFELQYSELLIGILGLLSLIQIIRSKVNKKLFLLGCFLLSSVIISNILLIIAPYDNPIITFGIGWNNYFTGNLASAEFSFQTIKMSFRIILYILITIASVSLMTENYVREITSRFIRFGLFVMSFAAIEFILKNIFQSNALNIINSWFFGAGDWTVEVLLERSSTFALQGFMREPAHFASAMFAFGLVLVFSNKEMKSSKKLLAVSIVMFLSRSFAAVIYIVVLFGIYAVVNNKKLVYSISAMLLVPLVAITNYFSYYIERLGNIIQLFAASEVNRTMSEHVRIISVVENLKILAERPFFGIGIGTTYAHGFIPTLLASAGIFGFALWFSLMYIGVAKMKRNMNNFIIIFLLLICWTFTGSIANAYSMSLLLLVLIIRYEQSYTIYRLGVKNANGK